MMRFNNCFELYKSDISLMLEIIEIYSEHPSSIIIILLSYKCLSHPLC